MPTWTKDEVTILTKMWPNQFTDKIAAVLERNKGQVENKAKMMGLVCSQFYLDTLKARRAKHALAISKKAHPIELIVVPEPSVIPVKVEAYGKKEGIAQVYRIEDRPAHLNSYESKPSPRNYVSGSSLGEF